MFEERVDQDNIYGCVIVNQMSDCLEYIYIYIQFDIPLFTYIYIYIYILCINIYIYIYTHIKLHIINEYKGACEHAL